jgi:putative transposase
VRNFGVAASPGLGYSRFMRRIGRIANDASSEETDSRLKIIEFFDDYGAEATKRAYGKSRSTLYLWKQKLKVGGTAGLLPGNRTPHRKRRRVVAPFVESFIIGYRTSHPGADKTTIHNALMAACARVSIKSPSESTIGRIIHDLKERGRLPVKTRVSYNARTERLRIREDGPVHRRARRKGFSPLKPGDLVEIDTVDIFVDGLKRYLLTAIDLTSRIAFAYLYKSGSSLAARDFLSKLKTVLPFRILHVQTDNGHEFLKNFAQACDREGLVHFFNYPRHPQSNAHLERFNRTIQEQFVIHHTHLLDDAGLFNRHLMPYLLWYNTEKPHRAIGNLSPLRYYLNKFVSPLTSNMPWTLTVSCALSSQGI